MRFLYQELSDFYLSYLANNGIIYSKKKSGNRLVSAALSVLTFYNFK